MPLNKDAQKRYRIIHNILRRGGRYKSSQITRIINDAGIPVSQRTVQKDLKDLAEDTELALYLPIEKDTKEKAYYYREIPKDFLPAIELLPEETKALLFYIKTIQQYKDYDIFNDIQVAVNKVLESSNITPELIELFNKETILETEKHPAIKGIEYIPIILDSINTRKIIEIDYQRHSAEIKVHKIKPLLIKEDKLYWYVIGINIKRNKPIIFALDRIQRIKSTKENFEEIDFNSEEFFKYSFGITVQEQDPIEVIISFSSDQGKYIKTLPIHNTQKIIKETKKKLVISVTVIPSFEFYAKILSYGAQAEVLSPDNIRECFICKIQESLDLYKKK